MGSHIEDRREFLYGDATASDNLGVGIECISRTIGGRPLVEYWVDGYLVATATLTPDNSPRVNMMAAQNLDVFEVLKRMAALNFAASRAAQMSFSARRR